MFSDVTNVASLLLPGEYSAKPGRFLQVNLFNPYLRIVFKSKKTHFLESDMSAMAGVLLAHHPYFVDYSDTSVTDIPSLIDKHFPSTWTFHFDSSLPTSFYSCSKWPLLLLTRKYIIGQYKAFH